MGLDEESKDEEEEEKEEVDQNDIDTEKENRHNFIKLEGPFYDTVESDSIDIEKTASFGEKDLLLAMPSFAKIGFQSNVALKNKKVKYGGPKEEQKQPAAQHHEIGPEYLSIDPHKNRQ